MASSGNQMLLPLIPLLFILSRTKDYLMKTKQLIPNKPSRFKTSMTFLQMKKCFRTCFKISNRRVKSVSLPLTRQRIKSKSLIMRISSLQTINNPRVATSPRLHGACNQKKILLLSLRNPSQPTRINILRETIYVISELKRSIPLLN